MLRRRSLFVLATCLAAMCLVPVAGRALRDSRDIPILPAPDFSGRILFAVIIVQKNGG